VTKSQVPKFPKKTGKGKEEQIDCGVQANKERRNGLYPNSSHIKRPLQKPNLDIDTPIEPQVGGKGVSIHPFLGLGEDRRGKITEQMLNLNQRTGKSFNPAICLNWSELPNLPEHRGAKLHLLKRVELNVKATSRQKQPRGKSFERPVKRKMSK